MTDKLIAAMEKTIVHRIAYLGGIIEYVEVYFYRLTKGDDSPEARVMRSQLHTINQDLDEMEDDYEEFKSLIQLSDREDDILRVYGGIISLFDLAGDEFNHFAKEFEDYVYKKIGKGEVE